MKTNFLRRAELSICKRQFLRRVEIWPMSQMFKVEACIVYKYVRLVQKQPNETT